MPAVIQTRRDTAANWVSRNPVLSAGEFGFETDSGRIKIGDGARTWATLSYLPQSVAGLSGAVSGATLTERLYYDQLIPLNQAARLRKWHAALAKVVAQVPGARAKIACVGDSNTAGQMAATDASIRRSWPAALADMLNGAAIPATWDAQFGNHNITAAAALDVYYDIAAGDYGLAALTEWFRAPSPWTWTGSNITLGGATWQHPTTANSADELLFRPLYAHDRVTVRFIGSNATDYGIAEVLIDDVLQPEIPTSVGSPSVVSQTFSVTQGTHVIKVRKKAGQSAKKIELCSIDCWSHSKPRVSVWNMGRSGMVTGNFSGAAAWTNPVALPALAPDLTIIALGTNDFYRAPAYKPLAEFGAAFELVITAARQTGDVLVVGVIPGAELDPGDGQGLVTVAIQQQYIAEMKRLAEQYGCAYLDMTGVFQSYAAANALGLYSDTKHINPAGHAAYARPVFNTIVRM